MGWRRRLDSGLSILLYIALVLYGKRQNMFTDGGTDVIEKTRQLLRGGRIGSGHAVAFDPADTWAHGYPSHRARLGPEQKPEWVRISPNTVPRSFVRPDDPRYNELKDLMPGHAERFPELPAHSYILTATDGVRSKVIDASARSLLIVRPLREYVKGI